MPIENAEERPDEDGCIDDPLYFSKTGLAYKPERDGDLGQYLDRCDRTSAEATFYGLHQYALLRDMGWLTRGSIIRLMFNTGRGDAHYSVAEDFKLEGIEQPHHGGAPGIHEPADIFRNAPPFEASHLWGPAWKLWIDVAEGAEAQRLGLVWDEETGTYK